MTNVANAALAKSNTIVNPWLLRHAANAVLAALALGQNASIKVRDEWRTCCRALNTTFLLPAFGGFYDPGSLAPPTQDPRILVQPISQTVPWGTNVQFSVGAAGASSLSYQWQISTDSIVWANNVFPGYTGTTTATMQTSGQYPAMLYFRCIVTDSNGSVTSSIASQTLV